MRLTAINFYVIHMPLVTPFSTHLETVKNRESIIIEIIDQDGRKGYGEVVAFSSPWYTEETVKTCYHMLTDFFIPFLMKKEIREAKDIYPLLSNFKGNPMAKAGLEMAFWDLQAKQMNISLSKLLGGTASTIPAGVVVGAKSIEETLEQIEQHLLNGYQRVKIKISPENDLKLVSAIRKVYPHLSLMADANSAYTLRDMDRLKALDEYGLLMIEQPLDANDIIHHATLQKELQTPICLDESIVTFQDAKHAIQLGSCQVINIKIGRVGGVWTAKQIHDLCLEKNLEVWCGGMLEFGVSRAHNIALASLPGFTIPGDISSSNRYWTEDITLPEVKVEKGSISVPSGTGIGFEINENRLKQVTVATERFSFS
ncbi:o-succinylbenzoate synthase [Cytobacillus spongiae]|jgi:O-succinylbenzoate synthase|uniref:o-succinylbenzoate synthase n=1 Tax=Cytobacillus spongiae TaxID=2901381 RepID=UPI001F343C89|nr:o-succinylbenzoate synthase [Cytobacillus spongiae]UII55310.1 o-succinylbenzoate synthase [Cytobacillus spongiae]